MRNTYVIVVYKHNMLKNTHSKRKNILNVENWKIGKFEFQTFFTLYFNVFRYLYLVLYWHSIISLLQPKTLYL